MRIGGSLDMMHATYIGLRKMLRAQEITQDEASLTDDRVHVKYSHKKDKTKVFVSVPLPITEEPQKFRVTVEGQDKNRVNDVYTTIDNYVQESMERIA